MDCSTPGFHVHHQLPKFAQTYVHQVGDATQPPHPLLLLQPSIFPSIRVFSNESSLHIRWPKYWSFSIHSSNEYSGWFPELTLGLTGWISLQSKGLSRVFSNTTVQSINSPVLSFLYAPTLTSHIRDYWENQSFDLMDLYWLSNVSAFFFFFTNAVSIKSKLNDINW